MQKINFTFFLSYQTKGEIASLPRAWMFSESGGIFTIIGVKENENMEFPHLPITLLHYGYLFNDLLKVRLNRNLLDCNNLAGFFMDSFEHAAIGPVQGGQI